MNGEISTMANSAFATMMIVSEIATIGQFYYFPVLHCTRICLIIVDIFLLTKVVTSLLFDIIYRIVFKLATNNHIVL